MSDEIPLHIQAEIIKRLPIASLLQFRSVSKAWKSLIDSSHFIAAHSVTQPQYLLLRYDDPESPGIYVSFLDDDTFPEQRFIHTLPQSVRLFIHSRIVGSSHGVLCLRGYYVGIEGYCPDFDTEMVVLWNPSIRKSIAVDVPKIIDPDAKTDIGFGVCPVTGDPKIVVISQFLKTSNHCEAKVYTVSSGKWRSLSSNLPSKPFRFLCPQVVVDRFIYWCALDLMAFDSGLPTYNMIMSFDMTNENFGLVDLPDSLSRHPSSCLSISKLRGSLVMLEHSLYKLACAVWMMENGVQKSFTKLFTVESPDWSRTITTLGFTKSGKPIMEVDYMFFLSELLVYEPNSERFSDLEISGITESFVVNPYMETLVLLGSSDCSSY